MRMYGLGQIYKAKFIAIYSTVFMTAFRTNGKIGDDNELKRGFLIIYRLCIYSCNPIIAPPIIAPFSEEPLYK